MYTIFYVYYTVYQLNFFRILISSAIDEFSCYSNELMIIYNFFQGDLAGGSGFRDGTQNLWKHWKDYR